MIRRCFFAFALVVSALVLAACNGSSPTSPADPASQPHGRLSGVVTIGPNCPVTTTAGDCPTPPGAYSLRKVLVYDANRTKLLYTVDIDSHGFYLIDLVPADYTIDLQKSGIDSSKDVPARVTILKDLVTSLNINIDTGIR